MANINVRIDDKMELALKKEANILGISLSDLVRERLTGETKSKPLNEVTLESRMDRLEREQKELSENVFLMTRFLYNFTVIATDANRALMAWEAAVKELNLLKEGE